MKCCICGTVRNCGKYLNKIFENMEQIGGIFEDYVIIFYYDQSNDDTLQQIKDFQKRNSKVIFYNNTGEMLPYRTHRLALGRNKCLELIRQEYSDYEYFIMMDCDDRCAKNMKINLLKNYLTRYDWDALSFDHPDGYYDTWALSIGPYVLSCHHLTNGLKCQKYVSDLIKLTPRQRLIACYSAFNGFAIYRTNKFLNCHYDGRFRVDYIPANLIKQNLLYAGGFNGGQRKEDCEHRFFHFQSIKKNGARIRISPLRLFI